MSSNLFPWGGRRIERRTNEEEEFEREREGRGCINIQKASKSLQMPYCLKISAVSTAIQFESDLT